MFRLNEFLENAARNAGYFLGSQVWFWLLIIIVLVIALLVQRRKRTR